jgi:hypothetical protein
MTVTLNRLKQYVDFDWSPEELTGRLTTTGLEIKLHLAATEWRQLLAHSASCGLEVLEFMSPGGATENSRPFAQALSPRRGLNRFSFVPTVGTVGYFLPLLRSLNGVFEMKVTLTI